MEVSTYVYANVYGYLCTYVVRVCVCMYRGVYIWICIYNVRMCVLCIDLFMYICMYCACICTYMYVGCEFHCEDPPKPIAAVLWWAHGHTYPTADAMYVCVCMYACKFNSTIYMIYVHWTHSLTLIQSQDKHAHANAHLPPSPLESIARTMQSYFNYRYKPVCMYACVRVSVCMLCLYVCVCMYVYVYMCTYFCIDVGIDIHIFFVYAYVCNMYVYVYMYV